MIDAELFRQILAIAIVFGLLGSAVWLLGRRKGTMGFLMAPRSREATHLEVVERLRVTPQHTLLLLRIGSRCLLIAVHPAGCCLLVSHPLAELLEKEEVR